MTDDAAIGSPPDIPTTRVALHQPRGEPDTRLIFRTTRLGHLLNDVQRGVLTLADPDLWMDALENLPKLVAVREYEDNEHRQHFSGSNPRPTHALCWSFTPESAAHWIAYAKVRDHRESVANVDLRVQLSMSVPDLVNGLMIDHDRESTTKALVQAVEYTSRSDRMQTVANMAHGLGADRVGGRFEPYFLKDHRYEYENEFRIVAIGQPTVEQIPKLISVPFDWSRAIKRVLVDLRANDGQTKYVRGMLADLNITPNLERSDLCEKIMMTVSARNH